MRVLYIITGLSTGGAETMLLKLLDRLDSQRYTPMVISLTTMGDIGPRIAALGIPVQVLGMKPSLPSPIAFLSLLRSIKQFKPDIVHTWLYHADLLGGIAARLAGVKRICWGIRSCNLDTDKTHWTTRAVRRVCALLSYVIPQRIFLNSETARRIHVSLGYAKRKMSVVPNGFDLSRFKPDETVRSRVRSSLGCTGDAPLVGMVGRFDPLKNHLGFISAMALMRQQMPQVHLIMVGKGVDDDNEVLVRSLAEAGLSGNLHLLGARDDVPGLMTALDVLVSPSHAEAFPNVIGEAMAAGVPCVATDAGDCAYIIGDTGYVVPIGDIVGLARSVEALLRLSRMRQIELGQKARLRVASHFEISHVVRQYDDAYQSLKANL